MLFDRCFDGFGIFGCFGVSGILFGDRVTLFIERFRGFNNVWSFL